MNDYQEIKNLLINYVNQNFPKKAKKKTTFFDVTGYPHYENVASNVLKFFFDANEEHGFRDLWLKSLLEAYNEKSQEIIDIGGLDVKSIEREYSNGFEKRIDLLIDARPLIIIIENKIYASVYNPFDIYTKMADNYVKDSRINNPKLVKIVLSLTKESLNSNTGFINVTYEELFKRVKESWWDYRPNEKWSIFAREFIGNLERKEEETHMKIDEKWIKFVNENGETLSGLFEKMQNDIDERVAILRKLDEEIGDIKEKKDVYNSKGSTYSSQFIDIKMKDGKTICFETYLMKSFTNKECEDFDKLYVSLWCRGDKNYDFDYILRAIGKENAKIRVTEGAGAWGKHHILDVIDMCKDFSIPELAKLIKNYIEKTKKLNS